MNKPTEATPMNNEQQARRKLLKMASYVPPAILGVMMGGNKITEAAVPLGQPKVCGGGGTIIVSANGNACCPCVPADPDYDPVKCAWKKCKLGNCTACRQNAPKDGGQCGKVAAACGCTCAKTKNRAGNNIWTCK